MIEETLVYAERRFIGGYEARPGAGQVASEIAMLLSILGAGSAAARLAVAARAVVDGRRVLVLAD